MPALPLSAAPTEYPEELLARMRHTCDPLADAVAARIERQRPSQMLDEVYARAASDDRSDNAPFAAFVAQAHSVPEWVDWAQIEQARKVSLAFANVRGIALLVSSLVEGYSLSKAAHVLIATGRLHQDVLRRVYETSQMSHNMNVPGNLRPGEPGHRTIMEVRLLHAMVRKYLRERGWDVAQYDEPINQEDMAFTIIEFNYLSIRGMARMGAVLSEADQQALHHLWRYVAYLNGVDEALLTPSLADEIHLYQRIRQRQYSPNEESRQLTDAVLTALAGQPPFNLPKAFLCELSRQCLGDELADAYALPRHRGWRQAMRLYQAGNRVATLAHYRLPGFAGLTERMNFRFLSKALQDNLPSDPEKRAFRHIA
ncbi:MAG: DUF2236 domain-containing protein [Alcanivorax sp.]|nr:DUF2236 domain-containing protein [Alcanivorax sp.]